MILYDDKMAPNPRRVRMFLAEKGIDVPTVQVSILEKQHRTPEHLKRHPLGLLPVLELDDGRMLAESVAICRYFEELHPEPPLFGVDAYDKANVERWNRHMEIEVLFSIAQTFRNTHPFWQGRIPQVPEWGEVTRKQALARLAWLNEELADREFIAGDRFSIADITGFVAVDFGRIADIRIAPDQTSLKRWRDAVAARPSAKA